MDTALILVHLFVAIALVALVLLQQGKGADMGAAFGSGASQTVFGSRGSGNFLTKTTGALAFTFFMTSLVLAYFAGQSRMGESVVDRLDGIVPVESSVPAMQEQPAAEDIPLVPEDQSVNDEPPVE